MSEYLMVDVNPQVSVMFEDSKPVRVFIDIDAAVERLDECIKSAVNTVKQSPEPQTLQAAIKFTKKEVRRMSEPLKTLIQNNGCVARLIKSLSVDCESCEIRFCRDGYNFVAQSSNLRNAKEKFIKLT